MKSTIDMAREVGVYKDCDWRYAMKAEGDSLKAFEALVRADERNELAKHFEQAKQAGIHTDWVAAAIKASGKRRDYDRYEGDNT